MPLNTLLCVVGSATEGGIRLAQWLLTRKIESQFKVLENEFARFGIFRESQQEHIRAIAELHGSIAALEWDRTLVALLTREALAAQSYWRMLTGTPLPWADWTKRRIPEHWTRISARSTGRRIMREATDPFNAMLNYGYTLLEVEARVACSAFGLDPDLGPLHVDERLRESFIYDLMEPVRARVDVVALEFAQRKGLRPYMFHELRDGVVRLDPDLARDFAGNIMPKLREPIVQIASGYIAQLRRVKVPYVLEKPTRRFNPVEKVRNRKKTCEYCKKSLQKRDLKFCGRECYLRHSVELRQPIKLAQQRLAELRAQGLSPGHGGEAARKRGAKISESNRRRAAGPLNPATAKICRGSEP